MKLLLVTTFLAYLCCVVGYVGRAFLRALDAQDNIILGPVRPRQPGVGGRESHGSVTPRRSLVDVGHWPELSTSVRGDPLASMSGTRTLH